MELKFKVLDLDTGKVYEPEDIRWVDFSEGKPIFVYIVGRDYVLNNFKLLPFTGEKDNKENQIKEKIEKIEEIEKPEQ